MPERASMDDLESTPHTEVFDGTPRTVRLALDAGETVPEHSHPGKTIVLHQLEGNLDLRLDGVEYELEPGDLIRFSGEREVSPLAITDSRSLLVFAPSEP